MDSNRGVVWPFAVVLAAYIVLGAGFVSQVPLFEAPDEPAHIHYVTFLAEEGRPPHYADTEGLEVPGEGMQPPLYYVLAAPLHGLAAAGSDDLGLELARASRWVYGSDEAGIRANELVLAADPYAQRRGPKFATSPGLEGLRALRLVSLMIGALTLWLTMRALVVLCADPWLVLAVGALLGLNPQFVFISSSVSNEVAASAIGAACLWRMAPVLAGRAVSAVDYRWIALLGALALTTKLSVVSVVGVSALTVLILDRRRAADRLRDAAIAAAMALLMVSPYLAWSWTYRGDPLGLTAVWHSAATLPTPEDFGGVGAYLTGMYPEVTLRSYWSQFGWMNVLAPRGLFFCFFMLTVAGLTGYAISMWESRGPSQDRPTASAHAYLGVCLAVVLGSHVWLNTSVAQPQGRHLFPAAAQTAALLGIGLVHFGGRPDGLAHRVVSAGVAAALAAASVYCLFWVIGPAYAVR